MVGNVELRQRGNNLRGGRLVIDLNSGRATVDGRGAARGPDGNPVQGGTEGRVTRSEEHTSELQSLMRISYAVFCLKKKKHITNHAINHIQTKILTVEDT